VKLAIVSGLLRHYPLDLALAKIREAGYDGVEPWSGRPHAYPANAGVFEDLPADMEEGALVFGSSWLEAFPRIALRPAAPGLAATTTLSVVFNKHEFLIALALMGRRSHPLPVAVASFVHETGINWGYLTATASLMMPPRGICMVFVRCGMNLGTVK
jgi:multiple sugar transport system permease protein